MRCSKSLLYCFATSMWRVICSTAGTTSAFTFSSPLHRIQRSHLVQLASTTASSSSTGIIPRVKTVDAKEPSEGPVVVKGWVRTVRKQKTLAFVEVNDGSNLAGIQVVASFEAVDDETKQGLFFQHNPSSLSVKGELAAHDSFFFVVKSSTSCRLGVQLLLRVLL